MSRPRRRKINLRSLVNGEDEMKSKRLVPDDFENANFRRSAKRRKNQKYQRPLMIIPYLITRSMNLSIGNPPWNLNPEHGSWGQRM